MDERIPPDVLAGFGLPAAAPACRLGAGHIHRTWRVDGPDGRRVLQRLNAEVFPAPLQVVENGVAVAAHLARRHAAGEYPLEPARPLAAAGGAWHVRDAAGAIWRGFEFIEGTRTLAVVDTPAQARVAAGAFGAFGAALADLDPARLHVVIPHFHDLGRRMEALAAAAAADRAGRAAAARAELQFCGEQQGFVAEVAALEARLPLRVCHNDTKIDNMLFDDVSGAARAVIDLDTCMAGRLIHDYGDMVRTFTSPVPEDSTRLHEVRVRDEVFAALTAGFVAPLLATLQPIERASLWAGARTMCLMVGVRFLTDWLDGDRYFATRHARHNLERARCQLTLYRDLSRRRAELSRYIDEA